MPPDVRKRRQHSRRMRQFLFLLHYYYQHLLTLPASVSLRWLLRSVEWETHEGIAIVDVSLHRDVDDRFRKNTIAALGLIKALDPRRFHRIQHEIKYIQNGEALRWASYDRSLLICHIDYGRIDDAGNEEFYLRQYASTLVHEATHGALYSRYIDYTFKLRTRIERLCHLEQKRFASKFDVLDRKWSKELVGEFDQQKYNSNWNATYSQRFKGTIARWRQSWRSRRSKRR